jgi:hypothetical protein
MTRTPHPVDPRQPKRRNRQPDYTHGYIAGRVAGRAAKRAVAIKAWRRRIVLLLLLLLVAALAWRTR